MAARRPNRVARAYALGRYMQRQVAHELQQNILAGVDGNGNEFKPLWANSATFPNGLQSDRAGEPALIESGALLRSIRPGRIVREGNRLLCYIKAEPYGLQHHRGFEQEPPIVIARTKALRDRVRSGNFGGIPRGDKIVFRMRSKVPPRPWISVSRDTVEIAIERARNGGI